jgi:hypothetical protein
MKNFLKTFLFIFSIFIIWSGVANAQFLPDDFTIESEVVVDNQIDISLYGSDLWDQYTETGFGVAGSWKVEVFEGTSIYNGSPYYSSPDVPSTIYNNSLGTGVDLPPAPTSGNYPSQYAVKVTWTPNLSFGLNPPLASQTIIAGPDAPPSVVEVVVSYTTGNTSFTYTVSGVNMLPENSGGNYLTTIYADNVVVATSTHTAALTNGSFGPVAHTYNVDPMVVLYRVNASWQDIANDYEAVAGFEEFNTGVTVVAPSTTQTISLDTFSQTSFYFDFVVSGEGLTPNGSGDVFVHVHPGGQINSPTNSQAQQVTADSNGAYSLPQTVQASTPGNYYIQVFLNATTSGIQDSESLNFTGEDEAVAIIPTPQNLNGCNDSGVYCLLEPIGTPGNTLERIGGTNGTDFGGYLNAIFQIGVAMAGIFGTLMIVIGGFTYMTTDSFSKKNDGKTQITNAVLGVLLALLSWLLLYTINPGLTSFDLGVNTTGGTSSHPWNGGAAVAGTNICPNTQVLVGGTPTDITMGGVWPSDSTQRSSLAGVTVNNGSCGTAGASSCTSLLYQGTSVDIPGKINAIKVACDNWAGSGFAAGSNTCVVVVTGGSECWPHSLGTQHRPNGRAVDFRNTPTPPADAPGINKFNAFIDSGSASSFGSFDEEGSGGGSTAPHWHATLN